MTFDIVALCRDNPDPGAMIAAMVAAGRDLRVDTVSHARLIQLYHPEGRLLLTIETARLVQVPGEVRRLLGVRGDDVPHPTWWVESRAPGNDPTAEEVARRFTHALLASTGGASWSNR
ncbi:hypothetical protein ADK67_44085 [Saccharothrix sp. NRRL B-16348]|uniref:hypothetical protein n=1 Tax=Saccharothrix sp. NRRL B-16348 TaxID=1415542 RepID=UPI0006AFC455|nr:hypothetical protein [Saccharothrix sp. NRRL B-16348]KOX13539.1 hypothetical protein ADK67_44085 [Saccharothrix sp. NRRL B-16348]